MKYSDYFCETLVELNYTHCFFVPGGNIMHLLESARSRFECITFVHEHSAVVAAEHFNVAAGPGGAKAFALVTAGPGVTNSITGLAGAWLESRELLVVAGQVKVADLARGGPRQRGHQEVNAVGLVSPVAKAAVLVDRPLSGDEILQLVSVGSDGRPGPIFMDFCLDVQATSYEPAKWSPISENPAPKQPAPDEVREVERLVGSASRPVILLGGGLHRQKFRDLFPEVEKLGIPLMTTWNAADYVDSGSRYYVGRPNIWGQRSANILIQQADLIIAVGTRLGLQQTGFNWQSFGPVAKVVHIDIDPKELEKGHPRTDLQIHCDAFEFLDRLVDGGVSRRAWEDWLEFCQFVRTALPNSEQVNSAAAPFVSPFGLAAWFSSALDELDVLMPSSSGGSFTSVMQVFEPRGDQRLITNKGLASMGYGLAGAIGAAVGSGRRVVLTEGDGGFTQQLQEMGTLSFLGLPVKIFLQSNDGYATIRGTQKSYFDGTWVGCDDATGLRLPSWNLICAAFGVPYMLVTSENLHSEEVMEALKSDHPHFFEVLVDPRQQYLPKVGASIGPNGEITSDPLHMMKPPLDQNMQRTVLRYIEVEEQHESY